MIRLVILFFISLWTSSVVFAQPNRIIRIGGKNFTEQFILVSITEKYLSTKGFLPKTTTGLGTLVMRKALEASQLDLVWDYTGTALIVYFHVEEKLTGMKSYQKIRSLDEKNNFIWLAPSLVDNGYALTMQRTVANREGIVTIDDLSKFLKKQKQKFPRKSHIFALDYEFAYRPDGYKPLQKSYDLSFDKRELKPMDPGLVYTALKNGQVLVGLTFTSDGRLKGFDLVSLEDNRGYFPAYYATPVIRGDFLKKHPQLEVYLKDISSRLDTLKMMELNRQVDIEQKSVEAVAHDFLKKEGLIP